MNEIIVNIILIFIVYFLIKYIKKKNKTIQILVSKEKRTDKEYEQEEEFKRIKKLSDEKEKNKIRY